MIGWCSIPHRRRTAWSWKVEELWESFQKGALLLNVRSFLFMMTRNFFHLPWESYVDLRQELNIPRTQVRQSSLAAMRNFARHLHKRDSVPCSRIQTQTIWKYFRGLRKYFRASTLSDHLSYPVLTTLEVSPHPLSFVLLLLDSGPVIVL